jgi:hypothetical protein
VGTKLVASLLTKDQEFQLLQAADAQRAAARAGLDVEIVYAKNNGRLQVEQLYPFVNAPEKLRPLAIIAQAVPADGLRASRRMRSRPGSAGCCSIAICRTSTRFARNRRGSRRDRHDRPVGDRPHSGPAVPLALPKGGNVLYIEGPVDSAAAQQRLAGVQEAVAGTSITLKGLNAAWTEASAEEAVRSWLRTAASQQVSTDLVARRTMRWRSARARRSSRNTPSGRISDSPAATDSRTAASVS